MRDPEAYSGVILKYNFWMNRESVLRLKRP